MRSSSISVLMFLASAIPFACTYGLSEKDQSPVKSHGSNSNSHSPSVGHGGKPICTGQEPPRKGAPFTPLASGKQKLAEFQEATDRFAIEHPEAAEFAIVSKRIAGKICFTDDDCATGDSSKYSSGCLRYEWDGTNGSCEVASLTPIPEAPVLQNLTCADVTCPTNFQCEVEANTGAVGCVEQRTCIPQ